MGHSGGRSQPFISSRNRAVNFSASFVDRRFAGGDAEIRLDAALPLPRDEATRSSPQDFPTHWLDAEQQRRERIMLGTMVPEQLRDRDYSFILGGAAESYAVPALDDCWKAAQAAIYRLVRACDVLDQDGIALYTPADGGTADGAAEGIVHGWGDRTFSRYTNITGQQLPKLLSCHLPPRVLDLSEALSDAIDHYYWRKREGLAKRNGEIILALFDGEPSNQRELVKALVRATYHVDQADELRIGLIQIGNNSIAEGFFNLLEEDLSLVRARHSIVKFAKMDNLALDRLDLNSLAAFLQTVAQ